MRSPTTIHLAAAVLLAGCAGEPQDPRGNAVEPETVTAPAPAKAPAPAMPAAATWRLQTNGAETVLALLDARQTPVIRILCPARGDTMLVNVPAFRPIGSEERLSFGSGGSVAALVADVKGDPQRGGVTASGAVKAELASLIAGPVSASYGAQTSGPHAAPPAATATAFVAACRAPAPPAPAAAPARNPAAASPCLIQDGRQLDVAALRAVGTEPFWNARIEGRCVTYSHPEDQAGTRLWTRYERRGGGEIWTGALNGRRFVLRLRPAPGCSDGMSDRRYPLAAELEVSGERRSGCAEAAGR
ncbi:hypothetical protein E2493_05700 [Sphingomonas parva]|uniref:Uncharacterized protein n=1 Tax=Sphingomonas parva TaxID=2555898 RepID=A0A4Y8ZTJ4_9SPHN|nr:hypothetical protein [Sphingomonas parva]TFI59331.1 hypothetical protein E2493_05700 [Sphingomonas parva]